MAKQIFIPLTDEILYEHPEYITGPLTPYHTDLACYRWLSVELNPEENHRQPGVDYRHDYRISKPKSRKLPIPAWLPLQGVHT